ncbi:MAG: cysteine dioxygenase family protein [Myxococcota bacterium]
MSSGLRMGDVAREQSPREWAVVRELLRRIEEHGSLESRWDLWDLLQIDMVDERRFGSMVQYDEQKYTRRILGEARGVELVLVGWLPGQSTLIHDHDGSLCAFKVLKGRLREEQFDDPEGARRGYRELLPGWVQSCGLDEVHRLSNASDAPAASLHLYTPPLRTEHL